MSGAPGYRDVLSPTSAGLRRHFLPVGRSRAGRPGLFPTHRKFRKNLLDIYVAYVLALRGRRKGAKGKAQGGKGLHAFHDVHENKRTWENLRNFCEIISYSMEGIYKTGRVRGRKNAGGKNEGNLQYVIENKWRKNVRFRPSHDVDENK